MEIFRVLADAQGDFQKNVEDKFSGSDNLNVDNIFGWAYVIAGVVAVGFIVYASIQYLTAQGDPGKISRAHSTIIWSVIGLIIVILASVITSFVFTTIGGA